MFKDSFLTSPIRSGLPSNPHHSILSGKSGLRVIADVHGQSTAFERVIGDASDLNLAVLCLGDLVGRGPDSPGVVRLMLDLIASGNGIFVPGNHCDAFRRALPGAIASSSRGGDTMRQFSETQDGARLAFAFAEAVAQAPLWIRIGSGLFTHAAFHPRMLDECHPVVCGDPAARSSLAGMRALQGEMDGRVCSSGRLVNSYAWCDQIPAGITVYVGHDVTPTGAVMLRHGRSGGTAVSLDTGAWTRGDVSFLDLSLQDLALEPFSASATLPVGHDRVVGSLGLMPAA